MSDIPIAPLKRILKENGASRVSDEAAIKFRDEIENYAVLLATESVKLSNHAGRKTVKVEDITLATS